MEGWRQWRLGWEETALHQLQPWSLPQADLVRGGEYNGDFSSTARLMAAQPLYIHVSLHSLTCPFHLSKIRDGDRPDSFSLPHCRKARWRRDGGGLQGRGHSPASFCGFEIPARRSGPRSASAQPLPT